MSGRETEARVLMKAAHQLKEIQGSWNSQDRDQRLDAALKYNQRVWTIFQSELSKTDNPLPPFIKRNMLVLSAIIDKRIFETMAFPSPEKLTLMIEINESIAAGLRSEP
jgi:flagellar protein FlaF